MLSFIQSRLCLLTFFTVGSNGFHSQSDDIIAISETKYQHIIYINMSVCQFFLEGRCWFGENCKFKHIYNEGK